jgi:hypothetical protein
VLSSAALLRLRYNSDDTSLYRSIHDTSAYSEIGGVTDLRHRYLTEDLPASVVPVVELAQAAGIVPPVHQALLVLGSALLGEDYRLKGRTLHAMGLEGMDAAAIRRHAET